MPRPTMPSRAAARSTALEVIGHGCGYPAVISCTANCQSARVMAMSSGTGSIGSHRAGSRVGPSSVTKHVGHAGQRHRAGQDAVVGLVGEPGVELAQLGPQLPEVGGGAQVQQPLLEDVPRVGAGGGRLADATEAGALDRLLQGLQHGRAQLGAVDRHLVGEGALGVADQQIVPLGDGRRRRCSAAAR